MVQALEAKVADKRPRPSVCPMALAEPNRFQSGISETANPETLLILG